MFKTSIEDLGEEMDWVFDWDLAKDIEEKKRRKQI